MGSLKIESRSIALPQKGLCPLRSLKIESVIRGGDSVKMRSEATMVMHRGKLRYTSKGSSGTLQTLPDSCCARAMSYLELREVELVGECSLNSKVRACSRELWLMLCEQQWPAVASSEALRKAVMMRHPRDYFIHKYLDCYSPRPLLDLDDHLVHLEIRQKGRSICSVAREARDVFRSGVTEYHEQDGILIEGLRCAVDCSDDDMFPPEASRLGVTYYMIRKSDGRVAILGRDSTFGTLPGGAPIGEGYFKCFPQYPSLRGMLPMNCELFNSFTPYVRGSGAGIGWRDTRKRDNYFEISTAVFVGTDADSPGNDRVPALYGAGTGKPPTVVVTKGQVEIRSIFMSFSGDLFRQEPTNTREHEQYLISSEELDLEDIRSVLAQHLRFG